MNSQGKCLLSNCFKDSACVHVAVQCIFSSSTPRRQLLFIYCWAELRKALTTAGSAMITVLSSMTRISDMRSKAHWDPPTDFQGRISVSSVNFSLAPFGCHCILVLSAPPYHTPELKGEAFKLALTQTGMTPYPSTVLYRLQTLKQCKRCAKVLINHPFSSARLIASALMSC